MATYTENLNLKKPDLTDPASIGDINSNMDIIDEEVGSLADHSVKDMGTDGTWTWKIYEDGTFWAITKKLELRFNLTSQSNGTYYDPAGSKLVNLPTALSGKVVEGAYFTAGNLMSPHSSGVFLYKCTPWGTSVGVEVRSHTSLASFNQGVQLFICGKLA